LIRVQREDFDVGAEVARLSAAGAGAGGLCLFVGLVRELSDGRPITAMTLEHYPAMAERELAGVEAEARARWPLRAVTVIHRYGRLEPGDRIVLVATAADHRGDAFEACRFLIDWLKTKAPFWKREETPAGEHWVAARTGDDEAAAAWDKKGE
jgi:molybdopterin synthase catalytic subunit